MEDAADTRQTPALHYSSAALHAPAAANEAIALLDSTVTKNAAGSITSKTVYGYNAAGRTILRWTTTYTADIISSMNKYEYAYNAGGDRMLEVYSIYSTAANQWEITSKIETEWDVDAENNKTCEQITYDRYNDQQILKPRQKEETTFQGSNTNIYKYNTFYTYSAAGTWVPNSKLEQLFGDDGYDHTVAQYGWNTTAGAFEGLSKNGYDYSLDETYLEYQIDYQWNESAWDWTAKTVTEYNAAGTRLSTTEYAKNGTAWQPVSKTGYEGEYLVHYDRVNDEFVKTYKDYTQNDENGNLFQYERYDWDAEAGQWYRSKIIGLCRWDTWSYGDLRVYQYIELGYDKLGKDLYRIQLVRNGAASPWQQNSSYKTEYIYDENGRRTAYITYNWAGGEPYVDGVWTFNWTNYRKTNYTYNEQGQTQLVITYDWIDGAYVENSRTTYYYSHHDVVSSVAAPACQVKMNAYPNPVQDNLAISGTQVGQIIRITNLSGQQIDSYIASEGETRINLSAFTKGVYIVTVDNFSVKIVRE